MTSRLRRLLTGVLREPEPRPPAIPVALAMPVAPDVTLVGRLASPLTVNRPLPSSAPSSAEDAVGYLARVQTKINALAEDFAGGRINRAQFQELYTHYQMEKRTIEQMSAAYRDESWRRAVTEGISVRIRAQHEARAQGYAIYENDSGMPLHTLGDFRLDPALVVPMLSSYRAATQEVFGAGLRSTEVEGGRWLCFVPGEFTTLLAIFSTEPARRQQQQMEELHQLFEKANRHCLKAPTIDPSGLLFPHEFFLDMWRK